MKELLVLSFLVLHCMLLAHAYGPGDLDISGDVHFDLDEKWTVGADYEDKQSRNLATISLHEIGHSLGLPHSKNKNDIMYPVYLKDPDPSLSRDDIKQLQSLYGADPRFKRSPFRRRFKPEPRKRWKFRVDRNVPKWCLKPFNDVMRGQRGTGYILNGKYIYKIDNKGMLPGYPVHIGVEFPGAPTNAMSSFYVREHTRTYFLKGTRIWRFTNRTLDPGFPMESKSRFPEKPRAALSITDRKGSTMVLLFGNRLTWRWNPNTERSNGRYHLISTYWRKLPKRLDAAVEWFDGYIYFFTRNKYFKVSKRNKVVLEGYPKFKAPSWLGGDCGNTPK